MSFALAHGAGAGFRLVVITAEVQKAVDGVKRQLCLNLMSTNGCLHLGDLGPDDQFTREPRGARFAERETEHIGRFIVLEIALVQLMNRRGIDEGNAYLALVDAFALKNGNSSAAHTRPVNGDRFLWTGD